MKGSEIKDLVIVKLEEYTPFRNDVDIALNAGGNSSDEVQPVLSYISKSLAQSANEMLRVMPLQWLVYKENNSITCTPDAGDKRTGSIALPTDFLRLHTLQMTDWERPVHRTISEGDADYKSQFCKWTRGTKQKPVALLAGLGVDATTFARQQVLKYYSVDLADIHSVSVFRYVPVFADANEYDNDAAELIALNCARKVAEVFGMTEAVTIFTNEITTVLENVRQ
jgi:hypothetical protein